MADLSKDEGVRRSATFLALQKVIREEAEDDLNRVLLSRRRRELVQWFIESGQTEWLLKAASGVLRARSEEAHLWAELVNRLMNEVLDKKEG